jgi:large subunit ribosomal protein L25
MSVRLHFLGEAESAAIKGGGVLSRLMSDVEVSCLPQDLPEFIEVDITALDLDQSIHLSEIILPKGVTLTALSHGKEEDLAEGEHSSYDQAVVNVHVPRLVEEVEEETDAPAEDEGEGEGEAATEE